MREDWSIRARPRPLCSSHPGTRCDATSTNAAHCHIVPSDLGSLKQQRRDRSVAVPARHTKSHIVVCVHVRAVVEEERHHLQMAVACRERKRHVTYVVYIRSASEQQCRSWHVRDRQPLHSLEHEHRSY